MTRDQVQGMCALHTALAKMDGYKIDKLAARFSAMADYCEHVAACGGGPIEFLPDAVATAIVGDLMHIPGRPFDRAPWRWMEGGAQ
jgi:hypothetical protein